MSASTKGRKRTGDRGRKRDKSAVSEQSNSQGRGQALANKAISKPHTKLDADLAKEIETLSPEEAAIFLRLVEAALKKRRILLVGYLMALVFMLGGMMGALYIYAQREPGQLLGWVFLVPFAVVGITLYLFGRWSRQQ